MSTQENDPPALLSCVSQKQLHFREGDFEDQTQEMSQHNSHGYTKVTKSTCPNLGAHWLGGESFALYHWVRSKVNWYSVAHEKGTV